LRFAIESGGKLSYFYDIGPIVGSLTGNDPSLLECGDELPPSVRTLCHTHIAVGAAA